MNINFAIKADDWQVLEKKIADYPGNAENAINSYLHGEGNETIVKGVTKYIPLSTDHFKAHTNLRKVYKHKKASDHAKKSQWAKVTNFNLATRLNNQNDFYYLYFVQYGLGTSKHTGGVQFIDLGIDSVYAKVLEGIHKALNREV